jgi:hypothetical protein
MSGGPTGEGTDEREWRGGDTGHGLAIPAPAPHAGRTRWLPSPLENASGINSRFGRKRSARNFFQHGALVGGKAGSPLLSTWPGPSLWTQTRLYSSWGSATRLGQAQAFGLLEAKIGAESLRAQPEFRHTCPWVPSRLPFLCF